MTNNIDLKTALMNAVKEEVKNKQSSKYEGLFLENFDAIRYGIDNGLSVAKVAQKMRDILGVTISEKALRSFCLDKGLIKGRKKRKGTVKDGADFKLEPQKRSELM